MDEFDPDQYIAAKTASDPEGGFDADAYLAARQPENPAKTMAFERGPNYPNAKMTDVSVPDFSMVTGVAGLAKALPGAVLRGMGAALPENIPAAIGETANSALLKSIGTSPGQIKGLMAGKNLAEGEQAVQEAANVGRKSGLEDIWSTGKGRRDAYTNFTKQEGENIGNLRGQTGNASPNIMSQVRANLQAKYNPANPDVFSAELPQVEKGINTIQNVAGAVPTNAGISKGTTALNRYNVGAKAMQQPTNALTDVANQTSQLNDAEILQKLGPEKGAQYLNSLKNERGAFQLEPAVARGFQREMVSRGGGKGIIQSGLQKVMDAGGYRAASKGLNALQGGLVNPIDLSKVAPDAIKTLAAYLAEHPELDQK
jgi:hypothetical protein